MTFPRLPCGCRRVQSRARSVSQEEKQKTGHGLPRGCDITPDSHMFSLPFLTRPQRSALGPHPDSPPSDTGGGRDTLTNTNRNWGFAPDTPSLSSPTPCYPPSSVSFLVAVDPSLLPPSKPKDSSPQPDVSSTPLSRAGVSQDNFAQPALIP